MCQFEPWVGDNYWNGFAGGATAAHLGSLSLRGRPPDEELHAKAYARIRRGPVESSILDRNHADGRGTYESRN